MDYLFSKWDVFRNMLEEKMLYFFLDYDGTLVPIANTPEAAVLSEEARGLLRQLSLAPRIKLAIVSGRSLADIKKAIEIEGAVYVGNHGLEIEGPGIQSKHSVPPHLKSTVEQIKKELVKKVSTIKGVFIEDKGLTLSVHYRLVDEKNKSLVKDMFDEITKSFVAKNEIKVNSGKEVLEIMPSVNWDKGQAALWLVNKQKIASDDAGQVVSIYIGDDSTDEDAFRVLERKGLTIFVGEPKQSLAQYYLKDTREVLGFIEKILGLRKSGKSCQN